MTRQLGLVLFASALCVGFASAGADDAGAQFSAEMVQRGPDGQTTSGKMYVGDGKTRMEMSQDGREIVRISDQERHVDWVLFPDQKSYLERSAAPGSEGAAVQKTPSAEADPCAGIPGLTCRRVGEEDVGGRAAIKWEMSATEQGETLTGAQWLDVERGLPLKSVAPNGQTMELKLLGTETIDGRQVEKWQATVQVPNQQPVESFQWYDPELKLAVRAELPGGVVSELKDVRVGTQPDSLFVVPAGYTRVTMPQAGEQPQSGR